VNWNAWAHTLTCLESLSRLHTLAARVVVCDNGSTDGSVERIIAWARGGLDALPADGPLRSLSHPPVPKPISHRLLRENEPYGQDQPPRLTLIQGSENRGFGAGCNLGIRYAMAHPDCRAIWLLNNDTVVHADALDALLRRLDEPNMGLCGSTLLHYDAPTRIQCQGGARFYRAASLSRLIGKDRPLQHALPARQVERMLDHLYGASMLVSRGFIEQAGPLPEGYFLYYEEMDWTLRGGEGWRLGYAADSLVYHRKGASAGTGTRASRSARASYQLGHSRLRFTRLHNPSILPVVYVLLLMEALLQALRGQGSQSRAVFRALTGTQADATCGEEAPERRTSAWRSHPWSKPTTTDDHDAAKR